MLLWRVVIICSIISTCAIAQDIDCPDEGFKRLPYPTSCEKFIECRDGEAEVRSCASGLHWHQAINSCDLPENANCIIDLTTEGKETEDGDEEGNATAETDLPTGEDGDEGQSTQESTDESTDEQTDHPIDESTDEITEKPTDKPAEETTDKPTDETTDAPIDEQTDEPTDESTEESTDKPTEETEDSNDQVTDEPVTEEGGEPSETEEPSTEEEQIHPNGECNPNNGEYVQFLTDKYNCDRFYKCDWGRPILTFCPDGLHFNPTLNICDWPRSAGCTVKPTTESEPTDEPIDEEDEDITVELTDQPTDEPITEEEIQPSPTESEPEPTDEPIDEEDEDLTVELTDPPTDETVTEEEIEPSETEEPSTEEEQIHPNGECNPNNGEYVQFLTDKYNCDRFYKCDWGRPILTFCPDGLHFNPTLNVCDWPRSAGCTVKPTTESEPTDEPIDEEDEDITVELTDQPTDEPITEEEIQPSPTEPKPTDEPIDEEDQDLTVELTDPPTNETITEEEIEPSETEEPSTEKEQIHPNGECNPINGEYVQFLTDKYNCDRFYKCDWGRPILTFCPDGLHFNPTLNVCDWPRSAGCTAEPTTESEPTDEPIDEDEEDITVELTDQPTDEPITDEEIEPSPTEPEATDEPIDEEDEDLTVELTDPPTNEIITEEDIEPSETEEPSTEEEQIHPNGECNPINGEYVQFLTDKYNCDRFYKCDWGRPTLTFCPDGLHFNPTLNVCDWPRSAGCTAEPTTESEKTDEPIDEDEEDITVELTDQPTDEPITEEEIEPSPTEPKPTDEPIDEEDQDLTVELTDPPTNETITEEETEPSETEEPSTEEEQIHPNGECNPLNGEYVQFLTDKYNCDRFYKCDWGRPILTFCPDGLHFNPTLNVCDWPRSAGCTAEPTTESEPTDEPIDEDEEDITLELTDQPTDEPITEEEIEPSPTEPEATDEPIDDEDEDLTVELTDPPTNEIITEEEIEPSETEEPSTEEEQIHPNGECNPINEEYVQFLTDKYNCDRFYKCDWGRPILTFCPDGLHFNPTLNVCDWPRSAGCTAEPTTESEPTDEPIDEEDEDITVELTDQPTDEPITEEEIEPSPTEPEPTDDPIDEEDEDISEEITVQPTDQPVIDASSPKEAEIPTISISEDGPDGFCNPDNGAQIQYLPDKLYCNRFYQCVWGQPLLLFCPAGSHFNTNVNVCDWSKSADCPIG